MHTAGSAAVATPPQAQPQAQPSTPRIVGDRIRQYRSARNLRQTDLASMAQVNVRLLSRWESGGGRVSAEQMRRIAVALDVPLDAFYEEVPSEPAGTARTRSSGHARPLTGDLAEHLRRRLVDGEVHSTPARPQALVMAGHVAAKLHDLTLENLLMLDTLIDDLRDRERSDDDAISPPLAAGRLL